MKALIRRAIATSGVLGLIVSAMVSFAPVASASDQVVSAGFCPDGWYGVIIGVQRPGINGEPQEERYFTACVQA